VRRPVAAFVCGGSTPQSSAGLISNLVATGRDRQSGDRSPHSKELKKGFVPERLRNGRSFAAIDNSQRAHTAVEMTTINAHQFGGSRDVALSLVKLSLDKLAMISIGSFLE
jgi:hypothetical protein